MACQLPSRHIRRLCPATVRSRQLLPAVLRDSVLQRWPFLAVCCFCFGICWPGARPACFGFVRKPTANASREVAAFRAAVLACLRHTSREPRPFWSHGSRTNLQGATALAVCVVGKDECSCTRGNGRCYLPSCADQTDPLSAAPSPPTCSARLSLLEAERPVEPSPVRSSPVRSAKSCLPGPSSARWPPPLVDEFRDSALGRGPRGARRDVLMSRVSRHKGDKATRYRASVLKAHGNTTSHHHRTSPPFSFPRPEGRKLGEGYDGRARRDGREATQA